MWKFYVMELHNGMFKVGISEKKPTRHLQDRASEIKDRLKLPEVPKKLDSFNISKDRTTAETVETQVITQLENMGFEMVKAIGSNGNDRTERFYKKAGVNAVEVSVTIRKEKVIKLKVDGPTVEWAKDEKRVPRLKKA